MALLEFIKNFRGSRKRRTSPSQYPRFLGLRRSAWIEILAFLTIVMMIDYFVGKSDRFFYISPHPFWLLVLLISVQYGTNEGLIAAFLCSVALLGGNLPPQTVLQDRFEYIITLIKNPVLWFVAAVLIGEARVRQIRAHESLQKELDDSHMRENTIAESYESLKKIKEAMEKKLAGVMHSAVIAYQTFKELESDSKEELFGGAVELMVSLIDPQKCSVYKLEGERLRLVTFHGRHEGDKFLDEFSENSPLYEKMIAKKQMLCVVNEDDRNILEDEGLIATPIYDPNSGQTFGMLKIEQLNFLQLKNTTLETLRLVGEWIGKAYANKERTEHAEKHAFVSGENRLFSASFYEYQRDYLIALGRRFKFSISLLQVSLTHPEKYTDDEKLKAAKALREVIINSLRGVDQPFEHQKLGTSFSILLPGTPIENVKVVLAKIERSLQEGDTKEMEFTFTSLKLHEE